MAENPFEPSSSENPIPSAKQNLETNSGRQAYNVVTDTLTGINVRKSDNKFQAICVVASMLILALIGGISAALIPSWNAPWYAGALMGGFAGMVVGIFSSGMVLMVYRGLRHLQGKHD